MRCGSIKHAKATSIDGLQVYIEGRIGNSQLNYAQQEAFARMFQLLSANDVIGAIAPQDWRSVKLNWQPMDVAELAN